VFACALAHGRAGNAAPLAGRRGITLRLALDDDLPQCSYTDPVRLRQVLLNLLSNAAKYAAPGEVLLIGEQQDSDHGPHCASRARPVPRSRKTTCRLFQPFSQLDHPAPSRSRRLPWPRDLPPLA